MLRVTRPDDGSPTLFRPSSQLLADYVPLDTTTAAGRARDAFQRRLEAANLDESRLAEVEAALRDALDADPGDAGVRHDLAFMLLSRRPDASRVAEASRLAATLPSGVGDRLRHLTAAMTRNARDNRPGDVPRRLNWSVTNTCPMVCKGCYNPFVPNELGLDDALRVVDRVADAGVESLMVSGGDPLLWPPLLDVLAHAKRRGLAVGLDTTGVTLTPAMAVTLRPLVDTVGLPLDGSNARVQRAFRRNPSGVHDDLLRALRICDTTGFSHFRVHTVVHRGNVEDLPAIAAILSGLNALDQWVLYQWWGRRASGAIAATADIDATRFEAAVAAARESLPGTEVVGYPATRRELANFFVQSNGQAVTFGAFPGEEFVIGNVLHDDMSTLCASPAVSQSSLVQHLVGHGFA